MVFLEYFVQEIKPGGVERGSVSQAKAYVRAQSSDTKYLCEKQCHY